MLEDVHVDAVVGASRVRGPDVALGEADEVERLLGETGFAVGARLRVGEVPVLALDRAGLALQVARCAVVPVVRASVHTHPLAGAKRQDRSLPSSSPSASTPFSVRIVSIEESQRS